MKQRVVITGLGCITPIGNNVATTWGNLLEGVSGIDKITHFDASTFPSKIAGEVKGFNAAEFIDDDRLLERTNRRHQLGIAAALMAHQDGIAVSEGYDPVRKGIAVGTTGQYPDFFQLAHYCQFADGPKWNYAAFGKGAKVSPDWFFKRSVFMASCAIAKILEFSGPNFAIHTACASGSHAVGQAFRCIQRGDADIMIAGGAEKASTPMGRFSLLFIDIILPHSMM